jgi:hypothetical protein
MLESSLFLDFHFHLAAANIMEAANSGASIAEKLSTGFWGQVFGMGLFGRISLAAWTIAGIGVIYKGYYYLQDVGKNTLDIDKVIGSLMALLLTVLMLQNSGKLSMDTVTGMKEFGRSINKTVMTGIEGDLASLQSTRSLDTLNSSQPFFQDFKEELKKCAPKAQAQCYQNAVTNLQANVATLSPPDPKVTDAVNQIVQTFNNVASSQVATNTAPASTTVNPTSPTPNQSFLDWAGSTASKAINGIVNAPSNMMEGLIIMILAAITICFYLALELTLILFGLTFPINVALSLFDPAPLKSWFGNFWLLINAKLCFCIIVGIISYLQLWVQTNSSNGFLSLVLMVMGLLMAIYAPFVTFFYVQGSALALAGAINAIPGNAIGGVAKGVRGAVGKVAGGAAGAFMGGAMKGAGVGKMGENFGKRMAQKLSRK